jgi:hypothetical protein
MCVFAKYKDIFGKPGTGAHSYRVLNVAVVDVVLTILGAILIWWFSGYPLHWVLLSVFVLGIVAHRLFCVNTTINKLIFGTV